MTRHACSMLVAWAALAPAAAAAPPAPGGVVARLGGERLRHEIATGMPPLFAFSPDGKVLASCNYKSIRLWDVRTGERLAEIRTEHRWDHLDRFAFSPDGKRIAGLLTDADDAPHLLLWDAASGKRLARWKVGEPTRPSAPGLAFTPDGGALILTEYSGRVAFRDAKTGAERASFRTESPLFAAWAAPDGKTFTTRHPEHLVRWDARTGKALGQIPFPGGRPRMMAWVPDHSLFALSPDLGRVLLWDPAAGKVLRELVDPDPVRIYGMAFTPDRKQLLTTHHADDADLGEARVWDVAAGKRLRSFPLPAFSATGHPAFSPDGKTLVFAASEPAVVLWDFATGKPRLAPPGHRREVLNLAFTPDGRTLVTGSADSVRAWDVATGKPLRALAEAARWMSPRFVPAGPGSVLLAGAPRREPVLLDIKTGEARARLPTAGEEKSRVAVLALAADGRTAVGISGTPDGRTHRLHVWDVAEGKEVESRLLRDDEPHDALLAGGDWLAGTARVARPSLEKSEKGDPADRAPVRLIVQDRKDGRPRMRATLPGAWGFAVAEVPGGYALATASGELKGTDTGNRLARSALHVWEIATGTPRLEIVREGGESDADLSDPAVSPDGRTLAAVWGERTVEIFDAWTGKELRTLRSDARVLELAFSPDGALLAAGLADGGVLIWDVAAVTRRGHPARQLSEAEAAACWDRLAADAKSAHAAAADLLGDPGRAVALLRGRLKPAAAVPEETVRGLIADLGSPRFARREEAARRLGALGDRAEPALRAAVAESPSGEVRERAGRLLDGSWRLADAEALRRLRAAEVLERLGTAEARALLRELASGDPRARETRAAQRALRRASP